MEASDYARLVEDVESEVLKGAKSIGILGLNEVTLQLLSSLSANGLLTSVEGIYAVGNVEGRTVPFALPLRDIVALTSTRHDVLVVAADEDKEDLLEAAVPFICGAPKVIVSGYGHLRFRDRVLIDELGQLLVPSLANGYPNTQVHLYQCLANAARLGLHGVVAEFGMFKGGTTVLLSRLIYRLNQQWPIIGFDTFSGFPARRSPLDMYDHPDCVFTDVAAVRRNVQDRQIEVVAGDIVHTCHRLDNEDVILTFMDTDNYTPARAALEVVRERTVVGGAIVFDHFTGVDRFRYTLGERMAAKELLNDTRYFNLHGTGVFYRQR